MRTVATVVAADTTTLATYLDQLASAEYQASRAGQAAPPQTGQPTVYGELWLLAVALQAASLGQWLVYALTSQDDIPGWPYNTGQYTGGIRGPVDIAKPLAAGGYQAVLRHYTGFTITAASTDVPLT